ncbi:MAG TPA: amidohydrolase family protein [Candidatus Binatia bacterium]|jgi:hypothetical protein
MPSFAGVYPLSHPFAHMQQLTSMMIHGVFERFPRLRVAFWGLWLGALSDAPSSRKAGDRIDCWPYQSRRSPKEIMVGGNLFYSCEVGEKTLLTVAQLMGRTQLLWPSDFPHEKPWDGFSGDLDAFIGRDDLTEATARQILWDNPCRLYGLSKKKLPANGPSEQNSQLHRPA